MISSSSGLSDAGPYSNKAVWLLWGRRTLSQSGLLGKEGPPGFKIVSPCSFGVFRTVG